MSDLLLFLPITKIDEARRVVYGVLTEETPDQSGEIFDYATGKSLGNLRSMHKGIAAGKFTDIVCDDAKKRIEGAATIVDDDDLGRSAARASIPAFR